MGWIDFTGAVDTAANIGPETDALLQLHCSGELYALIDVSGAWVPYSQEFAMEVPGTYTSAWLAEQGVVLTVLEANASNSAPATEATLTTWAKSYQTNYSLVNDPEQNLAATLGIRAWPGQYIVRLSDMQIVDSVLGAGDSFLQTYSSVLDGGS